MKYEVRIGRRGDEPRDFCVVDADALPRVGEEIVLTSAQIGDRPHRAEDSEAFPVCAVVHEDGNAIVIVAEAGYDLRCECEAPIVRADGECGSCGDRLSRDLLPFETEALDEWLASAVRAWADAEEQSVDRLALQAAIAAHLAQYLVRREEKS